MNKAPAEAQKLTKETPRELQLDAEELEPVIAPRIVIGPHGRR